MKITIPESTSEIKLGDYQKYVSIVNETDDETFQGLKMIELFCHVPLRDVTKMKMTDVSSTLEILNKAFTAKRKFKRRFTLNEVEFGFIPDLENISMGEYIDITEYLGDNKNLHKLMAVLYRPIKEQTRDLYGIEKYEGSETYSDVMKLAPLDVCLEASVFFYHLTKDLLTAMRDSSDPEVMKVMDLVQKSLLQQNGGGIQAYLPLVEKVI